MIIWNKDDCWVSVCKWNRWLSQFLIFQAPMGISKGIQKGKSFLMRIRGVERVWSWDWGPYLPLCPRLTTTISHQSFPNSNPHFPREKLLSHILRRRFDSWVVHSEHKHCQGKSLGYWPMASLLFIILLSRILSCLTKHCQSKKAQTRALSSQATHFQWVGQPDFRPAQLPHSGSPIIIFWPLTPPPISLSFSTPVVRKQYTAAYMHWWSLKHTWKCGKY